MKKIYVLALRECRFFFYTPFSLVIIPLFLILCGTYFYSKLDFYLSLTHPTEQQMTVAGLSVMTNLLVPFFQDLMNVLVFVTPIITMRIFSEDKKIGTYDLLVSYPLKPHEILLGKYFGALFLIIILLALSTLFPILVILKGSPYIPQMLTSYAGIFLFTLLFVAIGVVASLFTENQIVAALITYGSMLLMILLQWLAYKTSAPWDRFFAHFLFMAHLDSFRNGLVFSGDLALYLGGTLMVLSLGYWKIRQHYVR